MKTNPVRMCKSFNSHLPAECSTLRTDKFHKSPLELSSVQGIGDHRVKGSILGHGHDSIQQMSRRS